MKAIKRTAALILAILCWAALCSCGGSAPTAKESADNSESIPIGADPEALCRKDALFLESSGCSVQVVTSFSESFLLELNLRAEDLVCCINAVKSDGVGFSVYYLKNKATAAEYYRSAGSVFKLAGLRLVYGDDGHLIVP